MGTEDQTPIAHVAEDGREVQTLVEHLDGVAALAAKFVEPFCDAEWGRIVGRWHDLGSRVPLHSRPEHLVPLSTRRRVDPISLGSLSPQR